jgi:hypothetical protein
MTTKERVFDILKYRDYYIIGSFKDPKLKFKSDIDLNEKIPNVTPTDFFESIKQKYRETMSDPNIWLIDFKLGDLHWDRTDIDRGFKKIGNKKINFIKLLQNKSIIKIDAIANVDGRLYEFSNNYFLTLPSGHSTDPTEKSDLNTRLILDYYELLEEGQFFKALKRLYQLNKAKKKDNRSIAKFLNSEVGKLNRQVTSLKTLSLLINNNFRPVSTDLIKSNLEMIQSNLPPNYKPLISPILNSNNLKVMDKEINRVARLIAKDINGDTLHFLQNISKY